MAVVPFRWQGVSRHEKVRGEVESRLESWFGQWACDKSVGMGVRSHASGSAEQSVKQNERWLVARGEGGSLHLYSPDDLEALLGAVLCGTDPDSAVSELTFGVGKRALLEMLTRLLGANVECEALPQGENAPASATDPKCGVVALECRVGEVRFEIHLDHASCDQMAPAGNAIGELVHREVAILPCVVALQAVLDLGRVSLSEVSDLRPGEILKTDIRLDAAVGAKAGSKTVFSGALMAREGRRALRCVSTEINGEGNGR